MMIPARDASWEPVEDLSRFLADLVVKNLAPLLGQMEQVIVVDPSEASETTNPYTGEVLTQFLREIEPEVGRIARRLYEKVFREVPLEDLQQEGMFAVSVALQRYDAGKMKGEGSVKGYCKKWAHGAMCRLLTRELRIPTRSLEAYLEGENEKGMYQRELMETKPMIAHPEEEGVKRQRVLLALEQLSARERLVLMATYRIEDHLGYCLTPEEVKLELDLSVSTYRSILVCARRKLAHLLG